MSFWKCIIWMWQTAIGEGRAESGPPGQIGLTWARVGLRMYTVHLCPASQPAGYKICPEAKPRVLRLFLFLPLYLLYFLLFPFLLFLYSFASISLSSISSSSFPPSSPLAPPLRPLLLFLFLLFPGEGLISFTRADEIVWNSWIGPIVIHLEFLPSGFYQATVKQSQRHRWIAILSPPLPPFLPSPLPPPLFLLPPIFSSFCNGSWRLLSKRVLQTLLFFR